MATKTNWNARSKEHRKALDYIASTSAQPILVGSTIWFIKDNYGMFKYNIDSDTFSLSFKFNTNVFPRSFRSKRPGQRLCSCQCSKDSIAVVNGCSGQLIVFNAKYVPRNKYFVEFERQFNTVIRFPQIFDAHPSCIAVGDFIHVSFRKKDHEDYYVINSLSHEIVNFIRNRACTPMKTRPLSQVPILKADLSYHRTALRKTLILGLACNQIRIDIPKDIMDLISTFCVIDHNVMIKIGSKTMEMSASGALGYGKEFEPIKWSPAPHYALRQPIKEFGYIQHGPFIVLFGGVLKGGVYSDYIFVLDLERNGGWIRSPVKCQDKGPCLAVLDGNEKVHLFSKKRVQSVHFCIDFITNLQYSTVPP